MKRSFLSKLHRNGLYCIIGALLLFPGVLLYQLLILIPQGYGDALAAPVATLRWISTHDLQFLAYRLLLMLGFALMLSLPFTLLRIIVAQEILGADAEENEDVEGEEDEETDEEGENEETNEEAAEESTTDGKDTSGMPAYAWRGRGYAVIAAWGGVLGLLLTVAGTLASTIYLLVVSTSNTLPTNFAAFSSMLAFITYTVGGGLLAIACLFFGVVIARRGRNLWPDIWVLFSYLALALAALLSGSAVEVAYAPNAGNAGQAVLTTPAILLFAIWVLWFGIMLVRLQPE